MTHVYYTIHQRAYRAFTVIQGQ